MCVLPINMFNQKVFTIFFVWLGVLLIASLLLFIVRIFLVSSTLFRGIYVRLFYNLNLSSLSRDGVNMDVSFVKKIFWIISKVFSIFSGYFEENESWWLFASHISFRQHEFHRQSWICEEVRQWRLERSSGQILLKSRAKNFID